MTWSCVFAVDSPSTTGSWSWPTSCQGSDCTYRAKWSLDTATDVITFTITAKQEQNRWTGIGFAPSTEMVYFFDSLKHFNNKQKRFVSNRNIVACRYMSRPINFMEKETSNIRTIQNPQVENWRVIILKFVKIHGFHQILEVR